MTALIHLLIWIALVVGVAVIVYYVLAALLPLIPGFPPQLLTIVGIIILLVALLIILDRALPLLGAYG